MAIGRSSLFGRQLMLRSECADVARLQINAKTLILLVANIKALLNLVSGDFNKRLEERTG